MLRWSGTIAGVSGVVLAFRVSSWPGALVIRSLLESGSVTTAASRRRSRADVASIKDEQYEPGEPAARLDVYFPASATPGERFPTVVWVHGGAWIAGRKEHAARYFEMLALSGFTVIAVEYSRAPRARYPTPIRQINDAIAHVQRHAERFHVDDEQILLAGDSAGAQMSSQIAALVTNPAYAEEVGIVPSLAARHLRGVILFCGVYDASVATIDDGPLRNTASRLFVNNVLWAYTGTRDRDSATIRQMSTIDHATSAYPPTFLSSGNADPFTDVHSRPFAARLTNLGVAVTTLFFAADHTPPLGHQYQFDLRTTDGQAAFQALVGFMHGLTRHRHTTDIRLP